MNNEDVVNEINALRNDLIEPDGILDELKRIRILLQQIYVSMNNTRKDNGK